MKQFIVVIGGGKSQLPFVKAIQKNGYKVIVFDRDENCPARYISEKFFAVSTHDVMQVLKILKPYEGEIATCFTYSSYVGALKTAALVNDMLLLPGLRTEALEFCLSKALSRERCATIGMRCPEAINTQSFSDALQFLKERVSVILKPATGACGSDGVSCVSYDDKRLKEKFAYASSLSESGDVIIEEHIDGLEYSIDGYVHDNAISIFLVSRKYSLGAAYGFAIDGFLASSRILSDGQKTNICDVTARCVTNLGLNNSFFSFDVILKEDELYYIDFGCLLDAKIDVLLDFAGIDVYSVPAIATTGNLSSSRFDKRIGEDIALRLLYSKKIGELKVRPPVDLVSNELREDVRLFVADGGAVSPPRRVSDSLGVVLGVGRSASMLWRTQWAIDLANNVVIE